MGHIYEILMNIQMWANIRLLCFVRNEIVYFDSFDVEHIPEEIKEFIEKFSKNRNIEATVFRIQENNSIMWGYFSIGFIHFMLVGKKLTDYADLISPYDFKKNYNIISSYFKNE